VIVIPVTGFAYQRVRTSNEPAYARLTTLKSASAHMARADAPHYSVTNFCLLLPIDTCIASMTLCAFASQTRRSHACCVNRAMVG
jgi:hypothetical protein